MTLDEPRPDPGPAPLAPVELLRWSWRQLTSMRTALILLFLLAIASVPGSVVPQVAVDPAAALRWQEQHPTLSDWYERLGLFSVYDSAWFTAIYLLLMISLIGCILPRTRVYARGLRARPPRVPANLARLPEHRSFTTAEPGSAVLDRAATLLRGYRTEGRRTDGGGSIAAEKGYLREAGNLLFHVSVVVVLVGFAYGSLFGFRGGVIVVSGGTFANTLSQYDEFDPGSLFEPDDLAPFSFDVTDFDVTFVEDGEQRGMAKNFSAGLTYRTSPGAEERTTRIRVNHPLNVDGTKVFLLGHGYAPVLTVRDSAGGVVSSGPVIFLPEDASFRSFGVLKVPEAPGKQLGFEGEFYPTYGFTMETGPFTAFPDAKNPAISMVAWAGDLGLDDGRPQNVYSLEKSGLERILKDDGTPYRLDLNVGQTATLPDGLGSVTFERVDRFVKLQVNRNPGSLVALGGVVLALIGLLGSLFIRPRRIWVTVREDGGRTLVEVAGLDRSAGGNLGDEVTDLARELEEKS